MKNLQARNISIDFFRLLAAFFVVSLHTKFPIPIGAFTADIGKLSVPFFLMVSGYFLFSNEEISIYKKAVKGLKKVTIILVEASLVFAVLRLVKVYFFNLEIPKFDLIDFIIFNDTTFTEHLWYLFAFIYVLFVILLLSKFNLLQKALNFLPLFLIILIITATWTRTLPLNKGKFIYELNWLITGIPYVFLGMWVRKKSSIITNIYNFHKKKLTYFLIILFLGIFAEHILYKVFFGEGPGVVVTILLSAILFIISTHNVSFFGYKIDSKISDLGRAHALNIYLYHVLIREIIYLGRGFKIDVSFLNNTVSIFLLSLFFSILIKRIKNFKIGLSYGS